MKTSLLNTIIVTLLVLVTLSLKAQEQKVVLVAYYSKSGKTKRLAKAVEKGLKSTGAEVTLKTVDKVQTEDLLNADAIIVGSPVYNANVAPEVQAFINSWPFENSPMKNKLGAAFVTAGGVSAGEETAQLAILRSMLVFGMIVVGGPEWTQAFGASVAHEELGLSEVEMQDLFWEKGEKLGVRVGNLLMKP